MIFAVFLRLLFGAWALSFMYRYLSLVGGSEWPIMIIYLCITYTLLSYTLYCY